MEVLFDILLPLLFVFLVLRGFVRALRPKDGKKPTAGAPPALPAKGFDLDALMRALDAASGEVTATPPPLPTSVPAAKLGTTPPTRLLRAAPFATEGAFPDYNADEHFDRKHDDRPVAPRRKAAATVPAAVPLVERLHDSTALREAFVAQTILTRRPRR